MGSSLVINSSPSEVRVALLENRAPVEVYVERASERGVVGNIYRGKVVRVLPGMQAAFVQVGLERTAFLYVDDAIPRPVAPASIEEPKGGDLARTTDGGHGFRERPAANIADILKQGQDILVQVQKEPMGTKGARITRHITLPGRHVVFMPFSDHIGVSHRIEDEEERDRLRAAVAEFTPEGCGFIVRTAAEGVDTESLRREASLLAAQWKEINQKGQDGPSPRLIFADLDLVLRATRDLYSEDVDKIMVDNEADFERVRHFVQSFNPEGMANVELYGKPEPIFDHFGIEVELERALDRRVWLKSGGYIVIDQAEALTVIDVNSGRFVGKSSLEDTITQINLEAVKEVAYQLRLRNIGGIAIIDFIDMSEAENRQKVLGALEEALSRDKAKSTILRMSQIGLVEMTRKRTRESLGNVLTEHCPYCKGRGFIKSEQTVANEVLRAISRHLARNPTHQILVNLQPGIADYLYASETDQVEHLEQQYGTRIVPVARQGYHREHYEIVGA